MFNPKSKVLVYFFFLFAFCLLLIFLRFFYTISFSEPAHVQTGGAEDTGIFAVWLIKNKLYSYSHYLNFEMQIEKPHLLSAFHYNWLLYYIHSELSNFYFFIFKLNDFWLPTIIRLNTFFFSFLIFIFLTKIYDQFYKSSLNYLIAFYLIFGPLTGFWVISAKPDMTYLLFEVFGLFLIIKNINILNYKKVIIITFVLFLAWSVKQNAIVTISTFGFYLIISKYYKYLLTSVFLFFFLVFATINFGPDTIFESILWQNGAALSFNIKHFFDVLLDSISKSLVIYLASLSFLLNIAKKKNFFFEIKKIKVSKKRKFVFFGILISFSQIIFSAHYGSAVNYYFISIFYISIFLINFINSSDRFIINFSIFLQIALITLVIAGIKGRIKPNNYKNINEYAQCVKNLESPILNLGEYYRLPWITPDKKNNPIMINMMYDNYTMKINPSDRPIQKLVSEGSFKTLILRNENHQFNLSKYEFYKICPEKETVKIYILKNN